MNKPYRVLIKKQGKYKLYAKCRTLTEARLVLENINLRNLNKVYKRAKYHTPSYRSIANAYSKTAIQYSS